LEESQLENLAGTMDYVDFQILCLLQQDSRLSFNKIANKLGISVGTAFNRIKNLEKSGILKGYTIVLDSEKIGYGLTALILIQTEGGHLAEVEKEISKSANVIAIYDITGDYDAAVITKFQERDRLSVFIKNLMAVPHVKRTATSVALEVIKEEFRINLHDADASEVLPKKKQSLQPHRVKNATKEKINEVKLQKSRLETKAFQQELAEAAKTS
jgi:DNA-binding Lrp family transcriptional regulator